MEIKNKLNALISNYNGVEPKFSEADKSKINKHLNKVIDIFYNRCT